MIKIYNLNEITPDIFLKNHIEESRPCVIKNFFYNDKCFDFYNQNKDNTENYLIVNVISHLIKKTCLNDFIKKLESTNKFTDYTRYWKHNKGNITPWHYDGNGQNVINICLSGKKRFYLAPPGTIPVYPLSNVAIHYNWDSKYVDIEKYDLLYIPSYWFHKVITLEDNTVTINYLFYNYKNNNLFATNRDIYLYTLHDYFNTNMCENYICKITEKKPLMFSILYGLYEMLYIYFILLVLFFIIYKNNKKIYNIINCVFLLFIYYIYTNKDIVKSSYGANKLFSLYIIFFIISLNLFIKFFI